MNQDLLEIESKKREEEISVVVQSVPVVATPSTIKTTRREAESAVPVQGESVEYKIVEMVSVVTDSS